MADLTQVRADFKKADSSGSGLVPEGQLAMVFKKFGNWSDAEIQVLISSFGKSSEGKVNYNEFLNWLMEQQGISARHLAKYRPKCPILAVCSSDRKARQLLCHRGVIAMVTETDTYSDAIIGKAIDFARAQKLVVSGDTTVFVREHRDAELTETNSKVMK